MGSSDGYHTRPDGLRLHFREYGRRGEAPPLLCLHALTRNARDFHIFASRMAARSHVIVPDLRGRGLSDWDPEPMRYQPQTYGEDVVALLDHLGIAEAIIVGSSLGGIIAMLLAVTDGERVTAAILNDIGPELSQAGLDRIRGYVGTAPEFAGWREAAGAARTINRGFPAQWGESEWQDMARRLMSAGEDGRIRPDYDPAIALPFRDSAAAAVDMWPLFDALAAKPVLVLRGAESDLLTPGTLAKMAQRSPNVTAVTVPGVGHTPDLAEPEAMAAIDAFLERLAAPSARSEARA